MARSARPRRVPSRSHQVISRSYNAPPNLLTTYTAPSCLLRATDGDKIKISTIVKAKDAPRFQQAYSNILLVNMDALKKKVKKKKSKKRKAVDEVENSDDEGSKKSRKRKDKHRERDTSKPEENKEDSRGDEVDSSEVATLVGSGESSSVSTPRPPVSRHPYVFNALRPDSPLTTIIDTAHTAHDLLHPNDSH